MIGVAALTAFAVPANAQQQYCFGYVDGSYISKSGDAYIKTNWTSGSWYQVCNVKAVWKDVTPDLCVSWLAKIDVAIAYGKRLGIYYSNAPACSSIPTYNDSPSPDYVMLLKDTQP